MSQEASVLDLFNEFVESGGGGAPPYREPADYVVEATSPFVYKDQSLSLTCKITEGPLLGQSIGLGFIINMKSEASTKRSFIVLRQLGLNDEYLKQVAASVGTDKEAFLNAVAKAITGRVFKCTVVKDTYRPEVEANKLADRAKITLVSAPELPAIGGVPAAAAAAAPVAAAPAPVAAAPAPVPATAPAPVAPAPVAAVAAPVAAATPAPAPVAAPVAQPQPVAVPTPAPVAAVPPQAVAEAPAPVAVAAAAPAPVAAAITTEDPGF